VNAPLPGMSLRGLPSPLPAGERLLWQGAPDWRVLARSALHVRKLALYFSLIAAWVTLSSVSSGAAPAETALALLRAAALGAVPVGLAALYAWAVARGSVYTITSQRVVLHIGLALPVTMNLPFAQIMSADLNGRADGSGDISLTLGKGDRLSWIVLWPHARAWRLAAPQPTLRALRDVQKAGQILSRALAASADMAVPVLEGAPAPAVAPAHATMAA
jgi:hypothetical protein